MRSLDDEIEWIYDRAWCVEPFGGALIYVPLCVLLRSGRGLYSGDVTAIPRQRRRIMLVSALDLIDSLIPTGIGRLKERSKPTRGDDGRIYYRRGFQRIYLLGTITWIALSIWFVISNQWLWTRSPEAQLEILRKMSPVDTAGINTALAEHVPAIEIIHYLDPLDLFDLARDENVKWMWLIGLSTGPPLVGYLVFFYIGRWVYRGFKPRMDHP